MMSGGDDASNTSAMESGGDARGRGSVTASASAGMTAVSWRLESAGGLKTTMIQMLAPRH